MLKRSTRGADVRYVQHIRWASQDPRGGVSSGKLPVEARRTTVGTTARELHRART